MHPSIMLLQASIACAESDAGRRESFNRQHEQCPRTRRCVSKSPTRWRRALKAPAQWLLIGMMGWSITALAQPVDTWNTVHGFDCVSDPYNPIREDGTRDPQGDPEPLSADWLARDREHRECTKQRDHDTRFHPARHLAASRYGRDPYREPTTWENVRFRHQILDFYQIPDVPYAEVYWPCSNAPDDCPTLPAELTRFDPPYPVVLVLHGFTSQAPHHRFNSQVFAEHGYLAIAANGVVPTAGTPNAQREANGDDILNWLASPESGTIGEIADLNRVAFTGHSQGARVSVTYQGDPRVHAFILWDHTDDANDDNIAQPVMFQRTDGSNGSRAEYRVTYDDDRYRGRLGYETLKSRNVDMMHFTARATVHTDWNGYGVGLSGNRLIELVTNYYNLAWLDRYLKGRLAIDERGQVIPTHGRTESEERAYRQSIAGEAYARLTARYFDDSADVHNISMGFWDQEQADASDDPLLGGNVPFKIAGLETRDRLSPYFQSLCSLSVPNYVAGGTGAPDDPIAPLVRADTEIEGDMRFIGCPATDSLDGGQERPSTLAGSSTGGALEYGLIPLGLLVGWRQIARRRTRNRHGWLKHQSKPGASSR